MQSETQEGGTGATLSQSTTRRKMRRERDDVDSGRRAKATPLLLPPSRFTPLEALLLSNMIGVRRLTPKQRLEYAHYCATFEPVPPGFFERAKSKHQHEPEHKV